MVAKLNLGALELKTKLFHGMAVKTIFQREKKTLLCAFCVKSYKHISCFFVIFCNITAELAYKIMVIVTIFEWDFSKLP